jgi:anti-anti-sigma factor
MHKEDSAVTQPSSHPAAKLPAELLMRSAAAFKAELASLVCGATGELILDARAVTAIDAAGLQVLLAAEKAIRSAGGTLTLIRCSSVLLGALTLTGNKDRFTVESAGGDP